VSSFLVFSRFFLVELGVNWNHTAFKTSLWLSSADTNLSC
jgi:hypothetical protein